jgi:hypothetical protein
MHTLRMRIRAPLVALAFAGMLAGCGDSTESEAGDATTLRLHARQTGFQKIYLSKQGFRPGDAFISTSELDGGGHKEAYCVMSPRKKTAWCAVTVVRPQGQVTAEGVFTNAPKLSGTVALLSGTGDYDGARGSLATTGVTGRRESITIRLQ